MLLRAQRVFNSYCVRLFFHILTLILRKYQHCINICLNNSHKLYVYLRDQRITRYYMFSFNYFLLLYGMSVVSLDWILPSYQNITVTLNSDIFKKNTHLFKLPMTLDETWTLKILIQFTFINNLTFPVICSKIIKDFESKLKMTNKYWVLGHSELQRHTAFWKIPHKT